MAKAKTTEPVNETTTEKVTHNSHARRISGKNLIDLKLKEGLFYGVIKAVEIVENAQYGDSIRFKGEFCMRGEDPENIFEITARNMFLPTIAEEGLESACGDLVEGSEIRFGINLFQVPNEKSRTGYEWGFSHKLKVEGSNPLAEVQALLQI